MPIIHSYPTATPTVNDTLIGTKYIENQQSSTNSFNIGAIAQLVSNIIPGGLPSYGQLSSVVNAAIPISAANTWQPMGVVANLSGLNNGFSLGTTDKFALKNTSGSTKKFNASAYIYLEWTPNYYERYSIAFAKNGVIINETVRQNITVMTDNPFCSSSTINWIVELENNDELSVYIKISVLNPIVTTMRSGTLVATQV